jgi:hypothetical protein
MSGILKRMTFEILTMLAMMMVAFWVVTPCEPVHRYQSFRGTYCPEDGSGILSETSVSTNKFTKHNNPEDQHQY